MILQGRLFANPHKRPRPGWLSIREGLIEEIGEGDPPERPRAGGADALICPGFIDAHIHLPQFDSIGCEAPDLLEWLASVIYPAEAGWGETSHADRGALSAYVRMLRAGTLGYAGYLTSHPHSVSAAVRAGHQIPLRAIAGQVLMDRLAPDGLLGLAAARLARSPRARLDTSLNPRFALSCTDGLLQRTGDRLVEGFPVSFRQRDPGEMGIDLFVQTHLAESVRECELVREAFPDDPHYAGGVRPLRPPDAAHAARARRSSERR